MGKLKFNPPISYLTLWFEYNKETVDDFIYTGVVLDMCIWLYDLRPDIFYIISTTLKLLIPFFLV